MRKIFGNDFEGSGTMMVESLWLDSIISMTKNVEIEAKARNSKESELYSVTSNGVAVIGINGFMSKGGSFFFGGTATINVRNALRDAVTNKDVKNILLNIDSPGGFTAGTMELAEDVKAVNAIKPVHAHIDDLGASAAYWVASQASTITANRGAEVGSIGTVAVVEDSSEMVEKWGVKVHVVSTGEHKGAFTPGSEVTKNQLSDIQQRVNDLNENFLSAVSDGRGLSGKDLEKVSTGQVFIAEKAKALGLIDGVASLDNVIAGLTVKEEIAGPRSELLARLDKAKADL